jgi:hypothetical protein
VAHQKVAVTMIMMMIMMMMMEIIIIIIIIIIIYLRVEPNTYWSITESAQVKKHKYDSTKERRNDKRKKGPRKMHQLRLLTLKHVLLIPRIWKYLQTILATQAECFASPFAKPRLVSPLLFFCHFSDHTALAVRASFKIDHSLKFTKGFVNESAFNGAVFNGILLYENVVLGGKFFILMFKNKWPKSYALTNKTTENTLSVTADNRET